MEDELYTDYLWEQAYLKAEREAEEEQFLYEEQLKSKKEARIEVIKIPDIQYEECVSK